MGSRWGHFWKETMDIGVMGSCWGYGVTLGLWGRVGSPSVPFGAVGDFGVNVGLNGAQWGPYGAQWGRCGAQWGRYGAVGSMWGPMGSMGINGAQWGRCGAQWGRYGAVCPRRTPWPRPQPCGASPDWRRRAEGAGPAPSRWETTASHWPTAALTPPTDTSSAHTGTATPAGETHRDP